jgi:hypothetical protein
MLDFARYSLLASTLLNNYKAIYLVNNKDLLKLGLLVKAFYNKYIKAGSLSLFILGYSTRVIRRALNSTSSFSLANLVLNNIVVIKGFYINIILEA